MREETKTQIYKRVESVFKALSEKKTAAKIGKYTDCLGAIDQISLFMEDYKKEELSSPIIVFMFSDGVSTVWPVGSFDAKKYKQYLGKLEKNLKANKLEKLEVDVFNWYGASCYSSVAFLLTESADFQRELKKIWINFLTPRVKQVRYFLYY